MIPYTVLTLLIVGFIFWNSLQSAEVSNSRSNGVLVWLKPLLLQLFRSSEAQMHFYIRKLAHFIEFTVLGMSLGGLAHSLHGRYWRGQRVFFPLFVVLSVAVVDEFIQLYSDRTSLVKDIILDFFGGVFGVTVITFVLTIVQIQRKGKAAQKKTYNRVRE